MLFATFVPHGLRPYILRIPTSIKGLWTKSSFATALIYADSKTSHIEMTQGVSEVS